MKTVIEQRRNYPRYKISFPVTVKGESFTFTTEMKDISLNGLYCTADRFIPVQTPVTVVMDVPLVVRHQRVHRALSCEARIARIYPESERTSGPFHLGIMFQRLNERDQDSITCFVRQRNLGEAKKLDAMYRELKDMGACLHLFRESHPQADHFLRVMERAQQELDAVAFLLDAEIHELKILE